MKLAKILGLILIGGLLSGLPAMAKDKHGRHGEEGDDDDRQDERGHRGGDEHQRGRFSEDERQAVHSYCERYGRPEGKHGRPLPPGLAKKLARGGQLPPGWREKCRPGQVMPPEVYQECRPLPRELQVTLPAPPVGTITVAVGGKVVRLMEATREILDVFDVHVRF